MSALFVPKPYKVKHKLVEFNEDKKFRRGESSWGWNECFERNSMTKYTSDDTLTLIFEITVFGETKKSIKYKEETEKKNEVLVPNFHYKKTVQDFESLLM